MTFLEKLKCCESIGSAITYALTSGTYEAWALARVVMVARNLRKETAALAFMALDSLPEHEARLVASEVLPDATRPPVAPLFGYWDEAVLWAESSEPEELDAYCLACFEAMSNDRQSPFLNYIKQGLAA